MMTWWIWLIAGIGLLAIEMFLIDAEFYLVFVGVSAIIVGVLGVAGVELPQAAQWILFSVLAIVSLLAFRRRIYAMVRNRTGHVQDRVTSGDRVRVPVRLEPGQTCRLDYRGTSWSARNVDARPIVENSEAVISTVDELTLHLKPLE
jgi:membrane protein implicated in regulation of membrane protease activity